MNFLKSIFSKKEDKITSYDDFWAWFVKNEKTFFGVVKQQINIEKAFFDKLSVKLSELRPGFFFLTGMADENTAELIVTADGDLRNIVFVEELVKAAPKITGWKFTALKPALDIKDVTIKMGGYVFNSNNISFYSNDDRDHNDEINLTIAYNDFEEEDREVITNGIFIFLEHYLGELEFATLIDELNVIGNDIAQKEIIPINKLKDFLIWREKEFIEKYDGIRHNTENDTYGTLTAELENGNKLIAIVNTDVLNWDSKASHPWVLNIEIKYRDANNGMPDDVTYKLLGEIEDKIMLELKDIDGYINIGRETANSLREIYFACKDFRKPSKVLSEIQNEYASRIKMSYSIYKDKYWRSFERYNRS